jgi:small subunit ribosomal protein S16
MGSKKQPTYRFVVADSGSPRDGRFIEILGHYNPRTEPKTLVVDETKAKAWLSKGAQPSETVRRLFAERGIMERGPIPETKRKPKNAPSAASAPAAVSAPPAAAAVAEPAAPAEPTEPAAPTEPDAPVAPSDETA